MGGLEEHPLINIQEKYHGGWRAAVFLYLTWKLWSGFPLPKPWHLQGKATSLLLLLFKQTLESETKDNPSLSPSFSFSDPGCITLQLPRWIFRALCYFCCFGSTDCGTASSWTEWLVANAHKLIPVISSLLRGVFVAVNLNAHLIKKIVHVSNCSVKA